jgi:DNA-binding LytR/AlgR family response regulator
MKINCIIVDDEPGGRKVIEEYIQETHFLELVGKAEDPLKAMALMAGNDIGLIFLDIEMPRMNGIDFLRSLKNPPMVIMTTAFPEYALQGFELDVVDYLLKPVSAERFLKAAVKARDLYAMQYKGDKSQDYFFVKSNNKFERITFHELLFVEAANNYVILQTTEKRLITYLTFKGIEEILPAEEFIKVHKSFIVSLAKIDSLDAEEVRLGKHVVPISRSMKDIVMENVVKRKLVKR